MAQSTRFQFMLVLAFALTMPRSLTAQETTAEDTAADPAPSIGITFTEPVETEWEFGLLIKASANTTGITASVPIPMNWPEQEVEIEVEQKSDAVGKLNFDHPTKHAKQLLFKIPKMAAGQTETVSIRFKINKRMTLAPTDTTQFVLTEKVPGNLKTFLKPSPYIESNHRQIKEIAKTLKDDTLPAWEQVETIFRWVRDNVEYKFDEQIHTCLEALEAKHGDCEELSSLFIAICRAQGIPARAVWIPDHTYPEFYLTDKDGNGHWFPCQAAGEYQFGAMAEAKPILQKGDRFRINGERKQVRYLRPTLTARAGGVAIQFINRQVNQ